MRSLVLPMLLLAGCGPEGLELPLGAEASSVSEEALREVAHEVSVELRRGEARFVVTRTYRNDGGDPAELAAELELPAKGVVDAFRLREGAGWREAAHTDAALASERYADLGEPGEGPFAPVALLEASAESFVELHVWPLAPGTELTVQYEVRAPASYQRGEWRVRYPSPGGGAEPSFGFLSGLRLERVEGGFDLFSPHGPTRDLEARWAIWPLDGRAAWRLELLAAPTLGELPSRPRVVFVVDASHSQGSEGLAAQLEVIEGYLANVPGAEVEVIAYNRFAERLFGAFLPAPQVLPRLRAAGLVPANGSHLDEGLRVAAELRPDRVVLFTDERLRQAFDVDEAARALGPLPPGAVVHLVNRGASSGRLHQERLLEHELLPLARNGIVTWIGGATGDPGERASAMLGLVRPVRIDGLEVQAGGSMVEDRIDTEPTLEEGAGWVATAIADAPPSSVTVRGWVWSRHIEQVVYSDGDLVDQLPAILLGEAELASQLEEDEERRLARAIRAVSDSFSYFYAAPEGGAPPRPAAPTHLGCGHLGLSGFSSWGCKGWGWRADLDLTPELRQLVEPLAVGCGARGLTVSVETTGDEIVDVAATGQGAECLVEAIWALRLPETFRRADRRYALEL